MPEYDNRNTFVLFKNDKEGNDKRPDYKGTLTDENGVERPIAAWIKTPKAGGDKFMSGKVEDPREAAAVGASTPSGDDDIPF